MGFSAGKAGDGPALGRVQRQENEGVLWIGAVLFVIVLLFYALFGSQTTTWVETLTVTVATPNGLISASDSREVSLAKMTGAVAGFGRATVNYRGRAVAFEVTPGRWFFALTAQENGSTYPLGLSGFYDAAKGIPLKNRRDGTLQAALFERPPGTQIDLPRHVWPPLVTFTDLADPLSMKLLNPDDIAATFGPGFSLAGLSLDLADNQSDSKLLHRLLPWLCAPRENMMTLNFMNLSEQERQIHNLSRPGNFITYVDPACSTHK